MRSIHYAKPSITQLEVQYATDAARTGWGNRCYEYIGRFEELFRNHIGVKHAIATSSCTGALHMGLAAHGIGRGDEVILADINWIASAAPITYLGATPILVDILPNSWCIDPASVEEAITPNTKAIIAVHLYGNLCDMDALLDIGRRHNIPVIEDAAEAIGAVQKDQRAGSMGAFGAFSFHGSKTITTGEGGAFVTNDDDLYERVLTLSNHGRARGQSKQFWPDRIGFKYKMSNIEAAIGCAQVERIEDLIKEKQDIFQCYYELLKESGIQLNPLPLSADQPGYWVVNAVFPPNQMTVERRDVLIESLRKVGADARVFFWPLSMTGHFIRRHATNVSRDIFRRSLNLPSAMGITESDISTVCNVLKSFARD